MEEIQMRSVQEIQTYLARIHTTIKFIKRCYPKYEKLAKKASHMISDLWTLRSVRYYHKMQELHAYYKNLITIGCTLEWVLNSETEDNG